mmetsp:Transcript_25567/g.51994  ORF Transcript_25567/g.51994 Transcript_25567/m.51994 type:complete len:204 (+) Transcript_25567:759-1370(+)
MAIPCCQHQSCETFLVFTVDIGILLDQRLESSFRILVVLRQLLQMLGVALNGPLEVARLLFHIKNFLDKILSHFFLLVYVLLFLNFLWNTTLDQFLIFSKFFVFHLYAAWHLCFELTFQFLKSAFLVRLRSVDFRELPRIIHWKMQGSEERAFSQLLVAIVLLLPHHLRLLLFRICRCNIPHLIKTFTFRHIRIWASNVWHEN